MKYLDEYRDRKTALRYIDELRHSVGSQWSIMEVCGGQTHAIIKYGIDQRLDDKVRLMHGPGCPVCVTPVELIEKALTIASREDVIFCSFGDMLRVPSSGRDLLSVKADGGDVRAVYSPNEVLKIARDNPSREVVLFAIGFETTAPANAVTIQGAARMRLDNFSALAAQVLIPPAMDLILQDGDNHIDGFLAAGHVCTIMGYKEYEALSSRYNIPIVVTGFEPLDILQGILMVVRQLESGKAVVENQYTRAVRREGNPEAQKIIRQVFKVVDRRWRGFGLIPASGLGLREEYASFDAEKRFGTAEITVDEGTECISGQILRGLKKPFDCPAFARSCKPETPLGPTMVSAEGACSAYYSYRETEKND